MEKQGIRHNMMNFIMYITVKSVIGLSLVLNIVYIITNKISYYIVFDNTDDLQIHVSFADLIPGIP